MVKLLEIKEKLKNFYAERELFMRPIIKFIMVFALLVTIRSFMGIDNIVSAWIIVLALSVIFAFLPWSLIVAGVLAVIVLDVFSLSLELAALILILILIMSILFFRFAPEQGTLLIVIPLAFILKVPFLIPIVAGLLFAPTAVISVSFGTLIFYILDIISKNEEAILNISAGDTTKSGDFTIVSMVMENSEMFLIMASFVVTVLVVYFIRRLQVNNSWVIAIVTGGILNFVIMLVGTLVLNIEYSTVWLIIGTVLSMILAYILQLFVFSVDYTRTEHTQFEDDEYYYYVKAVPKINVTAPEMNVNRINARRKKKGMPKRNK